MYEHLPASAGDPIFTLMEAFHRDPSPQKVSLGIGLYFDNAGKLPILNSVRTAEERMAANLAPAGYPPQEGLAEYRTGVQRLVFGEHSAARQEGRIATLQTPGGAGAIHIASRFLHRWFPDSEVWVTDPTWDNHHALIAAGGCRIRTYPYYDPARNEMNFDAMMAVFEGLPDRAIVLMQPCCQNPTGIDLSQAQWREVTALFKRKRVIPFLDMAYQGFGDGLDEDAWAVRHMVDEGLLPVVVGSFSKNFALYGERVGHLSVVSPSPQVSALALGQLKAEVRGTYSNPPLHGGKIISTVLSDKDLFAVWAGEVSGMRTRILRMRKGLKERLDAALPEMDFSYLTTQRGMFSYTGLSAEEVDWMREKRSVYLARTGRMCVAGLNDANVDYVANAMVEVLRSRSLLVV